MGQVASKQVVADPVGCFLRIAFAFVPFERTIPITRGNNYLGKFRTFDKSIRGDATANGTDANCFELIVAEVFEPVVAGQQIDPAIAVHIAGGHTLSIFSWVFARNAVE